MTDNPVSYTLEDGIATIKMDDGKRNALSPRMFEELNAAIDRAETDRALIILTGREGSFSAGFDLKVLGAGGTRALSLLKTGYTINTRLLAYPYPVIAACTGHALAMGSFLLCSSDYRIGIPGPYKLAANEVAIGMTLPRNVAALLRMRLAPTHFQRAAILAETFTPETACQAGFLDELVDESDLAAAARSRAAELGKLDRTAHTATKSRCREKDLRTIRRLIALDLGDAALLGARMLLKSKRSPSAA